MTRGRTVDRENREMDDLLRKLRETEDRDEARKLQTEISVKRDAVRNADRRLRDAERDYDFYLYSPGRAASSGAMCGRFVLTSSPQEIEALFGIDQPRATAAAALQYRADAADPDRDRRAAAGRPGTNRPPRRAMLARWGLPARLGEGPEGFSAPHQCAL
jgi:hypothetical protein